MTQSTGDETGQGARASRASAAPQTPPDAPAAAPEVAPATPPAPETVRLRVTGPTFTDAAEVEVDGQRVVIGPGVTAVPSDQADAVIAAAAELGVTVEREEG